MTEQEIKAEHDRLRPILFECAPMWANWAAMDSNGEWFCFKKKPKRDSEFNNWYVYNPPSIPTKKQPETILHWGDSLIKRGDA